MSLLYIVPWSSGSYFCFWIVFRYRTDHKLPNYDNMYVLEKLFLLVLSIGVGALGVAGGCLAVKYMKNWTVIFHEKGIWHRNLMGKIYNFTDEEVKWYTITNGPKHYFITLGTDSKRIWINSYSSNYRQAKQLIQQKYQEWEHYAEENNNE